MIKKVKYTMLISVLCTGLLSGCTLFPLRENAKVSEEIQADADTPDASVTPEEEVVTPEPSVTYRPEDVIAPVKIPETEKPKTGVSETGVPETGTSESKIPQDGVMYCVSPVNIRDAAGTDSNVIGELTAGEKVTVYGKSGGWVEIQYQGQRAYVYEEYLSDTLN